MLFTLNVRRKTQPVQTPGLGSQDSGHPLADPFQRTVVNKRFVLGRHVSLSVISSTVV